MTPRPRSFNEEEVLGRAKDIFWRKGFEATSMQDLVDSMQIGRQSLYNTFGDKHTLFMRALEQYTRIEGAGFIGNLGTESASLPEIETYMGNLIDMMDVQDGPRACFLINTILELAPHDPKIHKIGVQCRMGLHDAFKRALEVGITRSEVRSTCNTHSAALLLTQVTMGFSPMQKSGATTRDLQAVLAATLAPMRASEVTV